MSESDTLFNERDWRCTAVQLMFSTDPSYDSQNHCWIATNNRVVPREMETKFPAMVMVFGVVSSEGYLMPPHIFEVGLKVNANVYLDVLKSVVIPWCNQVAGGRPGCGSRTRHRPTNPKRPRHGFRRSATTLYSSLTGPPPLPTWTCGTTLVGHMSKTSPTWPHTTPKPAWSPPSTKYSPALVKKACSQFQIRIEVVIEAEGGYIE